MPDRRWRGASVAACALVSAWLSLTGCSGSDSPVPASTHQTGTPDPGYVARGTRTSLPYKTSGYPVTALQVGLRPFDTSKVLTPATERDVDADGVAIWNWQGRRYPHPVIYAQHGLDALNTYRLTKKQVWLDRAVSNAQALVDDSIKARGALFFQYLHVFPLHGDKADVMRPPWYSGMAQGIALSLFTRLYEQTADAKWLKLADATFASFTAQRTHSAPWVAFVDESGYLWLEEYAKDPPMRVLNGHNFAVFGIWDYARVTGSPRAATLYDAAATTTAHYIGQFRRPGHPSVYSLRIQVPDEKYHRIHTAQLRMLARMTGDAVFSDWSAKFASDFA